MTNHSLIAGVISGNEEVKNILTLAGSVAHELRDCLAIISTCALVSEGKISDIKRSVKSADYLISNLQLQMRGIVSGKAVVEDFKRSSVLKDINDALEMYPFGVGEKGLITVKADKTIDSGSGDFEYFGNPVLTVRVLYNLIKNSLRAIKNAGKGAVIISLKSGIKYNQLTFKDTATGIPKEFLPKIFEPYESTMVSQGGTGIGLAFCKFVMKSYGGDISCTSVEGKFTEFVLSFPEIK
ncbi:hypothetical protein GAMM_30009 [Gammaproteobacteria bacterium]